MKKSIIVFFALIVFPILTFGQQQGIDYQGKSISLHDKGIGLVADSIRLHHARSRDNVKLELPKTTTTDRIITHAGYSLVYNEKHEQAAWVAYDLTKSETNKVFKRVNRFAVDPLVATGTASDQDYEGSGYDRGHLAPAADMGYSATTMRESFYYSNMSPQKPSFNRGIWKKLEELVRSWAIENDTVYVVTGPVLVDWLQTIGPDKVSIPNYYYKVVLDYSEPDIKAIGFILPNDGSKMQLQYYAVPIDSVEKLTGIDFFPLLDDNLEEGIEKTLCITCWSWKNSKKQNEKYEKKDTASVQCSGITKTGAQCLNKTLNASGYCHRHERQNNGESSKSNAIVTEHHTNDYSQSRSATVQCSGTTKAGNRCTRMTRNSSGRCFQHEPN